MSTIETTRPTKSLPTRLHGLIENAGWERGMLDRVARSVGGHTREVAIQDRVPAYAFRPTRRHRVSVIIPCYNYARFLPTSIGSALSQDDVDVEVIVVNDASTDDSLLVATHYARTDSRVQVVDNLENLGHVRTFNAGYARATGDFIVRLDADDLLTEGSLARALALFENFPEVGLVYGHPRHFTTEQPPSARSGRITWTVWDGRSWVRERCRRGVNCITTPEAIVRASVMAGVGPLNTNLRFAQDMEMWLRVAAVSDVARLDDVDQALHRDHDASMSVNEGAGILTDLIERRQVFRELFKATGERFDDLCELDRDYRRALAHEAIGRVGHAWDRGRYDPAAAAELVAFAQTTFPEGGSRWDAVLTRVARERAARDPMALARVARRRMGEELAYLRWTRTGL